MTYKYSAVRATTPYYDAKLSGVVANGTTDDTDAWARAIATVSAAGGGKIWWEGSSVVSQIVLASLTGLKGLGKRSRIVHKVGRAADQHCILLNDNAAIQVSLEDFTLNGNRTAGQTGFACGIYMYRTATPPGAVARHVINNVNVESVKGTGIRLGYDIRSSIVNNVVVYYCDEYGIRLDTWSDNLMSNVDIGQSGDHGLYINGCGQTKFSNIKSWCNGRLSYNAATNTPPLQNGTGTIGDKYRVSVAGTQFGIALAVGDTLSYDGALWSRTGSGATAAAAIYHLGGGWNQFSNIGTQENPGNGMLVVGTSSAPVKNLLVEGLHSDSDNVSDGPYYGLSLNYVQNSTFTVVTSSALGTDLGRYPDAAQPYAAVAVSNSSNNRIVSNALPVNLGGSVTWPILGNSIGSNSIDLCRSRLVETPSAASVRPNPYTYCDYVWTLTGNKTILEPNVATSTNAPVGLNVTLIFIQDATGGRTITWDTAYNLPPGFVVDPSPNAKTVVEFQCQADGDWLAVSTNQKSNSWSLETITAAKTFGSISGQRYVVLIGASGAPTLPTAANNTSLYTFKNVDTSSKTILTTSSQTIEGSTTYVLPAGASIDVVSSNSTWRII